MSPDFKDLLSEFNARRVEYLVVGAHALAAHGRVRATGDLDVWVRPEPDNAKRVLEALAAFGAPLSDLRVEDLARPGTVFQIGLPPLRIDVLTGIDAVEFDEAWNSRFIATFAGEPVPVLSVQHLIRNKRAVGRAQDLADVEWLEKSVEPRSSPIVADAQAPVIAIDGPSASGKGTIASRVAAALGFHYLESGALYRLVALADGPDPAKAAAGLEAVFRDGKIYLSGQDVTEKIRDEAVGVRASEIAGIATVRAALLERQRGFRRSPGLVADGRDMGTVVFPDATLKVFLTAGVAVRAQRRYKQLIDKGNSANLATLSRELEERDQRDATREVAPLKPAADAACLDSSDLTIVEVVDRVLNQYRERTSGKR